MTDVVGSGIRWGGVPLQVLSRGPESSRVVVEQTEAGVASAAEDAAYHAGAMAVVDRRAADAARARDGLGRAADRAVGGRKTQGLSPLLFLRVVPEPALKGEAATAERPERGRVRPTVAVLVSKGDVASGTVRARDSHCPILPARMGNWYGNAVTPNAAEVLVCALVEAITGEELSRHEGTAGLEQAA